jgi:hypothetical protein
MQIYIGCNSRKKSHDVRLSSASSFPGAGIERIAGRYSASLPGDAEMGQVSTREIARINAAE